MDVKTLEDILRQAGAHQYGLVETSAIPYSDEVRRICEGNVCRGYGTTWACPPAVGTLEECRQRCDAYPAMMVFTGLYPLEDSFDLEGMQAGHAAFRKLCNAVDDELATTGEEYRILGNESCDRCAKCTWPDAPCRFPKKLFHAIEGYGILVNQLAGKAGVKYINGPNTVTYFGGILHR